MEIVIYCDGACRGNQTDKNIGAWGYVLSCNGHTKEGSGVEPNVTNNRMELLACVKALEQIKNKTVPTVVRSDSQYLIATINFNWQRKANVDIWQQLDTLLQQFTSIRFEKVKGHSGDAGNERADELCNIAMDEYIRANPAIMEDPEHIKLMKQAFAEMCEFANFMIGLIDKYKGKTANDISDEDYLKLVEWQSKGESFDNAVVNTLNNL